MSDTPEDELPPNWDRVAWAASAREYALNRLTVAPPAPEDYAGPIPVGLCPTCGHDPCQTPGFCASCRAVDRRNERERQTPTARSLKIRRLVADPTVSLDRAWNELNSGRQRVEAAQTTVDALMVSLLNRGPAALTEIDTRWRIGQLSHKQALKVMDRLLKPKHWTPWSESEVKEFFRLYKELHK